VLDSERALAGVLGDLRREVVREVVVFRNERNRRTSQTDRKPKSAQERPSPSSGTGFFVGMDGQLLTNNHVVEQCQTILVAVASGKTATGTVSARDASNDLALIRTDLKQTRQTAWRQGARLGEAVAAFGFPLATVLSSSGNFTMGHITALAGLGDDSRYVQISAPIQPGNSGGPLLDQSGNLIGIVTGKLDDAKFKSQNVNFAIAGAVVVAFLDGNDLSSAGPTATAQIPTPDLAALAKSLSAQVLCLP
jgi:serine protease Do